MKTFINKKTIGIFMAILLIINLSFYHYFLAVSVSWAAEEVVKEEIEEVEDEANDVNEEEEKVEGDASDVAEEETEEEDGVVEEVVDENEEGSIERVDGEIEDANLPEEGSMADNYSLEEESNDEENLISEIELGIDQEEGSQNEEDQSFVEIKEIEMDDLTEENYPDGANVNVAEEVENITESVSDTGSNSISGLEEENFCEEEIGDETESSTAEELLEDESVSDEIDKTLIQEESNEGDDSSELEKDCIRREDVEGDTGLIEEEGNQENLTEEVGGENLPEDPLVEEAEILTGDAGSQAISLNEINTNIVTENGEKEIINVEDGSTEDVNLLEVFEDILKGKDEEGEEEDDSKTEISNVNVATEVKNVVVAVAETGKNVIENMEASANIDTGDAEAIAAVINLINTNIVGDNWYLAVVNILGDWAGDLIVPGEGLLTASDVGMKIGNIININEATNVENSVIALAETGENSIEGVLGESIIKTGNSSSSADAFNMINTNIISNNWFFLIINEAGNWVGQVINWGDDGEKQLIYEYDLGSSYINSDGIAVDVYNYNNATNVSNTVQAVANTGGNEINNAGESSISTGNASAWASVFNFINTNIVGNNWFFGIVNNMGNWTGDLVFAYPDLEVSIDSNKTEIEPGESMTYTVNYRNLGEADCDNVELMLNLPDYITSHSEVGGLSSREGDGLLFSFPGLKSGEANSFQMTIDSMENIPVEVKNITGMVGVRTDTEEPETSNNYASVGTDVIFPEQFIEQEEVIYANNFFDYDESEYALEVDRREKEEISLGEIATYSILVENTGEHSLYNIEIKEKVRDPLENVIAEYYWNIGELEEDQTALIEYQVFFDEFASLGIYNHRASAFGFTEYNDEIKSNKIYDNVMIVPAIFSQGGEEFFEDPVVIAPVAEDFKFPSTVLGIGSSRNYFDWNWLWVLLAFFVAYLIRRNKLYKVYRWQELTRRFSSFF